MNFNYLKDKLFSGHSELDQNILLNILSTLVIKGGALVISVLSMPVYIKFFNDSKILGIWFTLLSIMTWILSCDLGIGNGLRNNLVEALVSGSGILIKKYIVSAYVISSITAIFVGTVGYWIIGIINWNHFFNISTIDLSTQTLVFSIRIIFIGIILQFVLKLITSVLYALQKPAMTNLIALISSSSQLLIILFLPLYNTEKNLIILSFIYGCCSNIPLVFATIIVFTKELKIGPPQFSDINFSFAMGILRLGGAFFFAQILFMFLMNTNEVIITRLYGSEYVVDYQIYNKIFTIIGSLFMIALTPLWSAITKAYSEKNIIWLHRIYKKLNVIVFSAALIEIGIAIFIKPVIYLWVGKDVILVQNNTAILFALFGGFFIYQSALSTIACGLGKLKTQIICYILAVFIKVFLIYIGNILNLPWIFLIVANMIAILPYCVIQPRIIRKHLGELKNYN